MANPLRNGAARVLIVATSVAAALASVTVAAPPGASRDFNGDGFDDLAIGIPEEQIDGEDACGAVQVFYGSADGVTTVDDQFWHQNRNNIRGACEVDDVFGQAIAWGDFDDDGFDDLAIGIPNEDVNGVGDAGAVAVLYGSPSGLRSDGNQLWSQDSSGIRDDPEQGDAFGARLATGDFNGDGFDDLAIGVLEESIDGVNDAGALHVIFGTSNGLDEAGDQFLHQNTLGVEDDAEELDFFATSLAAGDFDRDGRDDLAVGVQREDIGAIADGGAMHVFYGSNNGLKVSNDQFWHQDAPGVDDLVEPNDQLGANCATGDFNGDNFDDLAIGIENEDIESIVNGGAVYILDGSNAGLTTAGDQFLHQDTPGIEEQAEEQDNFSDDLVGGDFDGDGFDDLAIGIENEGVNNAERTGAVALLHGGQHGLRTSNDVFLHQNSPGIPNGNEDFDLWGNEVTSGDFDGDGIDDLVVGAPEEDLPLAPGQTITKVFVTLNDIVHTFPSNIDVLLVGPEGENLILMSDAGGSTDIDNVHVSFSDDAVMNLPENDPLTTGIFRPTNINDGSADDFPAPAPPPSSETTLSIFNGTDPLGRWRLFIRDDLANDVGALDDWTLILEGMGSFRSNHIDVPEIGTTSGPADPYPSSITVPNDALQDAGAVTILYGSPQGITSDGAQFLNQNSDGVENKAQAFDRFGEAL